MGLPRARTIDYYRERCDPPLTQAGLARAINKHVNTIQYWERHGVSRPANLLAIVALFVARGALADYETALRFWHATANPPADPPPELLRLFTPAAATLPRDVLPAQAPLPAGSLMPLRRNPLFTGREHELLALAAACSAGDTVAITGIGGIGKTQLAAQFVHHYGQFFSGGVFWVSFAAPGAVPAGIAACGGEAHMALRPDFDTLPIQRQVRLVQAAWREPAPRLLVFDNCEDEALLAEWQPASGGCRVLVTSRRARWNPTLVAHMLALLALERAESVKLLRRYYAALPAAGDQLGGPMQHQLDAIAGELGDLPLALHLAGSYLAQHYLDIDPACYLAQLRSARGTSRMQHPSLQSSSFSPTGHDPNLASTLALSYGRLRPANPTDLLAIRLLARAARFAAGTPIPRALLLAALPAGPAHASQAMAEEALARLLSDLGLLELVAGGAVRMHPLVADFVHAATDNTGAQADAENAVLEDMRRLNDERLPGPMLARQAHLRAVVDPTFERADAQAAELCAAFGWQLVLLSAFAEAQRYLLRALEIRKHVFGDAHPATADSLGLLGLLHQFEGGFEAARAYYERALAICQQTLGPEHPETGSCHNNLGYLLFHLEAFGDAQTHLRRALAIHRRAGGLKNAGCARVLNNLGYTLLHCHKHAAARRYLKLALAIREQVLPANSPATAQTLNNLGEVLFAQGEYEAARHCHERALAMRDASFGPGHFHAAESMRNIGRVLLAQGQYAAARGYLERAAATCSASIGDQHIETAWKLDTLGEYWLAVGEPTTAQSYFERALAVYSQKLPAGHRDIVRVRAHLAAIEPG